PLHDALPISGSTGIWRMSEGVSSICLIGGIRTLCAFLEYHLRVSAYVITRDKGSSMFESQMSYNILFMSFACEPQVIRNPAEAGFSSILEMKIIRVH